MRSITTLVVLAAWLGAAIVTASVVAPAAFAVLPSRALAGLLVGRVLPPLFIAGVVAGAVAAALQWGAPGAYRPGRVVLPIALALACAGAQFGIGPRIARLRAEIGPSVDALPTTNPLRREFGRLHGLSVAMLGTAALAGAVAIVVTALAARSRS